MTKCEHCDTKVDGVYRCTTCHSAWMAGFEAGDESVRRKLNEVIRHLIKLSGFGDSTFSTEKGEKGKEMK